MTTTETEAAAPGSIRVPWHRRRDVRISALILCILLMAAAIVAVVSARETMAEALSALRHPSPWALAVAIGGVVVNISLTSLLFSVLISRYGRVGIIEMQMLIAGSLLLNFLPLRPGMFGRIAYHKKYNEIRIIDASKTIVQALIVSIIVAMWVAASLLIASQLDFNLPTLIGIGFILCGAVSIVRSLRPFAVACAIRLLELLVWAARYIAAFNLIGVDINFHAGLVFACVSTVTALIPILSNGLGVREWAVGLSSQWLIVENFQRAITADLVNRAAEILVVVAIGPLALWWVMRRMRGVG